MSPDVAAAEPVSTPERVRMIRAVGMRVGDLVRDPRDGMTSVVKTIAMGSWLSVTGILFWEAYYHSISAFDLLMYSMTSAVCGGGPMAMTVVSLAQPRLAGVTGKYATPQPAPVDPDPAPKV